MKQEDRIREPQNIVWQTRAREQTEFEKRLSVGMEGAFADGVTELDDLVSHLNRNKIYDEHNKPWTSDSFCAAMAELS